MERLAAARVAVFGLGGVGGYVVEALARGGVGALDLIDHDTVSLTNLNRQIFATRSTVGRYKVDVARERVLDINPEAVVHTWPCFYMPETADQFDLSQYSYIVDAIDTVTGKLELITRAQQAGTILSAMGAGNKLDPTAFVVTDLSKTSGDGLARGDAPGAEKAGRAPFKGGLFHRTASKTSGPAGTGAGSPTPQYAGERAFVPPVAGLVAAGAVIRDLAGPLPEEIE